MKAVIIEILKVNQLKTRSRSQTLIKLLTNIPRSLTLDLFHPASV